MKFKKFMKKFKGFVSRNAYAIVVSLCVLVAFSVITAISVADLYRTDTTVQVEDQTPQPEPEATENVPASTSTVIVFDCPVNDCTVSKDYYDNELVEDKTSGVWKTHQAIDYIGAENAEVYSVYDGTVEKVENTLMDGVVITIKHNNSLKSIYKSLGEACVSVGDSVKKGEQIGVMGTSTGEQAEGVHLHFEVMENDKLVNPNKFIATAGK
ncbi:MAG: M23 family metallopeptidase [Clostridia bacterium]|nr:M23 family metallopeptidase [Clostridia bacterium]